MIHKLCESRLYMGILLLAAIGAYGYKVTNTAIGIDDTPSLYYFEEGLIAIVGRWVLFLLNKVITLAEFVPFVTGFCSGNSSDRSSNRVVGIVLFGVR